jgi:hypothetical protein
VKFAFETGSGALLYMFHKDWYSHSKVNREDTHIDTHIQQGNLVSLLLIFKIIKYVKNANHETWLLRYVSETKQQCSQWEILSDTEKKKIL